MDELEKRVKIFFTDCKKYDPENLPPSIDSEFQAIRKEYYKTLEEADEKVQLQYFDLYGTLLNITIFRYIWQVKCMNLLTNI